MRYLGRFGLLIATLILAVASVVLMAWLYQPGADPSRIDLISINPSVSTE
jgi:hypothetical protein